MIGKSLISAAGALSFGLALVANTVTPASADPGSFVAGMIGGTALGAIAAGGLGPRPIYVAPRPVYVAPVEYAPAECWMERRPVLDPYGDVVGYRRTRICE